MASFLLFAFDESMAFADAISFLIELKTHASLCRAIWTFCKPLQVDTPTIFFFSITQILVFYRDTFFRPFISYTNCFPLHSTPCGYRSDCNNPLSFLFTPFTFLSSWMSIAFVFPFWLLYDDTDGLSHYITGIATSFLSHLPLDWGPW